MPTNAIKKDIRNQIKELKSGYSPSRLQAMSQNIIRQMEQLPAFRDAQTVMAYWSLPDEVDTHRLIKKWCSEKQFVLPVVKGRALELRLYQGEARLQQSRFFGIMEPTGPVLADFSRIDFVVVPGLAFSADGCRLGYGGGYYDRLLPHLKKAVKVAVAFPFQKVDEIPMNDYDVKVDKVLWA